jgi:acetyl esterase/lipase
MTLDRNTAAFLQEIAGVVPPLPSLDDNSALVAYFSGLAESSDDNMLEGEAEPVASVENRTIPGPEVDVPVRIYRPDDSALSVIVFFHGGVFIMGGLEMHDPVLRRLANAIPAVIVSVDYRLAPAHPFPAAVDDGYTVLRWAATHAKELGGDPRRLGVMGDSAGGALAAVLAIKARDEDGPPLALQVLVYPMTDPALETDSARDLAEGYLTTTELLRLGWHFYLDGHADEPYTAPSTTDDLQGLPTAIVVTAGYDPLRDEGLAYIDRLRNADVDVIARHYADQIHGFAFMPGVIPAASEAIAEIAELVRAHMEAR